MIDFKKDIENLLLSQFENIDDDLKSKITQVSTYINNRAYHLSLITDDPDFMVAVAAERDNAALMMGLSVVDGSKMVDQRVLGAIQGALMIGARVFLLMSPLL